MKYGFRLLSLLVIGGVVLTSCGGGAAPQATSTPPSGGAAATTAPSGGAATTAPSGGAAATSAPAMEATGAPSGGGAAMTLPSNCSSVQLAYWTPFTGPDGPFMMQLTNQFDSANPNIKVTMTTQSDYGTKMATAAAADQLPDVAIINEDQIATSAFNHLIRPMDDVVKQAGLSGSDFPDKAWKIAQVAGHTYVIPLSIVPMTMYYNNDLFKKANISAPPKNGDDFTKDAQAMTQGNVHGFVITTGFPVQQIFQELLHQYGGSEFNDDATQATWNSDAGVKALTWMKDAQSKYAPPKLPVDADLNAFKAGQAGMIWNGIWQTSNVTGQAVDFDGKATATPQIGTQPATWAGMANLGLPMHKKGEDACKTAGAAIFIKYILDNSAIWAKAGNIPAYNKARNDPSLKSLEPQADLIAAGAADNPVFPPPVPGISDAFSPLGDAVGAVMGGSATDIKGALDSAANRANQILAQNKQKYGTAP